MLLFGWYRGSKAVESEILAEGLDKIFEQAGMALRQPGCSACLAMNDDKIPEGKYAVSTSNRKLRRSPGTGSPHFAGQPADRCCSCCNRCYHRPKRVFVED